MCCWRLFLFIALARTGIILSVVREITLIKTYNQNGGIYERSIGKSYIPNTEQQSNLYTKHWTAVKFIYQTLNSSQII